jgi:pSer/pThr/pTyr-binding forkhead associated (FHA) protein
MGELQYVIECYPYGPILLSQGEKFTIGRRPSNVLVLPLSSVSRDHAAVEWGGDAFYLFDLNSSNGTHVNNKPTKMHRLESGDRIRIGPFGLSFKIREAGESGEARQAERGMLFAETTELLPGEIEKAIALEEKGDIGRTKVMRKPDLAPSSQSGSAMKGKLSEVALVELLQFLEHNRKTGTLWIRGPVEGEFYLREGRIVHAVSGSVTGEEAAYKLLHLVDGTFEMDSTTPECKQTIQVSTAGLIFEALRKADEQARHQVGS